MAARLVYINDEGGCDASGRPFRSSAELDDALWACDVLCVSQTIASVATLAKRLSDSNERCAGDASPSMLVLGKNVDFACALVAIQWWGALSHDKAKPRTLALHDCWQTVMMGGRTTVPMFQRSTYTALMQKISEADVTTLRVSQEAKPCFPIYADALSQLSPQQWESIPPGDLPAPASMPKKLHLIGMGTDPWFSQCLVRACAHVAEIAFLRVPDPIACFPPNTDPPLRKIWLHGSGGGTGSADKDHMRLALCDAGSFAVIADIECEAPAPAWAPELEPADLFGSVAAGPTLPLLIIQDSDQLQCILSIARDDLNAPGHAALAALRKRVAEYRIGEASIFATLTTRDPITEVGYVKDISAVCTGEEELRSAVKQVLYPRYECEIDTIKVYRLGSTFHFPCLRILSGEHTYLLLFFFRMTVREGHCSEQTPMWCVYDATGQTLTAERSSDVVSEFARVMDIDIDLARRHASSPKN